MNTQRIVNVERLSAPTRIVIHFASTADRDAWLSANAPERKPTHVPGLYTIKRGKVGVFVERVTLYGAATALAPAELCEGPRNYGQHAVSLAGNAREAE